VSRKSSADYRRRRKSRREYLHEHWLRFLREEVAADCARRGEPRDLNENEVLLWADGFFSRHGDWPNVESGPILEAPGETWLLVAAALALGIRGLRSRSSLAGFIDEHRRKKGGAVPRFTIEDVLGWAETWQTRTGRWPTASSSKIPGADGVTWAIVDEALRVGRGGLPGGSSLGRLLAMERLAEVRSPLCEEQILAWADAHYRRTGRWPRSEPVAILEAPHETWSGISLSLYCGRRGLPGGSSLPRLLMARRQVRSRGHAPPLEIHQILEWADAFRARTKRWPTPRSGPICEAPGESWHSVSNALQKGQRGLPGGSTIARLLVEQGRMRHAWHASPLTIEQILQWADAFHAQTGEWPKSTSGSVPGEPRQQWSSIEQALRIGHRGLPGGSSLFRLLALHRGERDPKRFAGALAAALSRKSRRIGARSLIAQRIDPRIRAFLAQECGDEQSEQGRATGAGVEGGHS
jgi:hypothetical protein